MKIIHAVPTNIITGFLGVGKTSAILHLLKHKPQNERWAVLVNEFGEIGIDGELVAGNNTEESGVFIREVPGGCMCCASGIPMQMALNMLLAKAKPDRLLIEPTGLGHPTEVRDVLLSEYYKKVIALNAIVTLVDARKIADPRYLDHDTFIQQIEIADVIVANKQDLYGEDDFQQLQRYLSSKALLKDKQLIKATQGRLDPDVLTSKFSRQASEAAEPQQHGSVLTGIVAGSTAQTRHAHPPLSLDESPIPDTGFLKVKNQGQGFHSIGWRFQADWQFDHQKVSSFLNGLSVERAKAVFITGQGVFGFNMVDGVLSESALEESGDSRIEIIATNLIEEGLEESLLACVVDPERGARRAL